MGPQPHPSPHIVFGPFEFDGGSGELRKHNIRLKLTGQPLRILEVLLERPGEAVSREELQQRLWKGTTFVDFENGLNAAISKLRQSLGDSAEVPRYIETVPGRGYRFIATVRRTPSRPVLEMVPQPASDDAREESPSEAPLPVEPAQSKRSFLKLSPVQYVAAAVALAFVAAAYQAAIKFAGERRPLPTQTLRFRVPIPPALSDSQPFAISPDGRSLVYAARGTLWLQSLDSLEPRRLPGIVLNADPPVIWSPDSKLLAFYTREGLYRVDLKGNPPQLIGKVPSVVLGGSWSPNGTILFGTETPGVMRIDARGGDAVLVATRDSARGERVNAWPTLLPDGEHFIYSRLSSIATNNGVFVGSMKAKPNEQSLKRLVATPFASQFVPSPDGNGVLLFQRDTTLWAQNLDTSRLELTGEPKRVAENVGSNRAFGFFSASANGVLVHRNGSGSGKAELTWFDRQGKNLGPLGRQRDIFHGETSPAFSPDGTEVALAKFEGDNVDVWVHDIARDVRQRITFDPALDVSPIWSPDGKKIVFSSGRAGHYDLYEVSPGGGREELLYSSNENKYATSWSPDGRFLLFTVQSGNRTIWSLPMEGSGNRSPIALTTGMANHYDGKISPDSRWMASVSDESGIPEIYVQPFEASQGIARTPKTLISREGGIWPHWRADGKELLYRSKGMLASVAIVPNSPLHPGIPKDLFRPAGPALAVTRDGTRFLVGVPIEQGAPPFTVVVNWRSEDK